MQLERPGDITRLLAAGIEHHPLTNLNGFAEAVFQIGCLALTSVNTPLGELVAVGCHLCRLAAADLLAGHYGLRHEVNAATVVSGIAQLAIVDIGIELGERLHIVASLVGNGCREQVERVVRGKDKLCGIVGQRHGIFIHVEEVVSLVAVTADTVAVGCREGYVLLAIARTAVVGRLQLP